MGDSQLMTVSNYRRPLRVARLVACAAAIGALATAPTAALAHSGLASTTPADGAVLESPPDEVVLVFEGELDPDGSAFVVTDADGRTVGDGELDLTVADRNELRGAVTIDEEGSFKVAWTAVAADGHRESGQFAFSSASASHEDDGAPNTAMRPPSSNMVLIAIGIVLVVIAVAIAIVMRVRWRRSTRP